MTEYTVQDWTPRYAVIGCKLKQNANEGCNSCASLAGLALSFIACFILLVIAPLTRSSLCPHSALLLCVWWKTVCYFAGHRVNSVSGRTHGQTDRRTRQTHYFLRPYVRRRRKNSVIASITLTEPRVLL